MGLFKSKVERAEDKLKLDQIALQQESVTAKRELLRARKGMIQNSGYDKGGASSRKNSLRGWNPFSRSPQEDIDANLHTLRQRSRDLLMTAPLAVSAINTKVTNVIGSGLELKCMIDFEALGMTREQAEVWGRNTEKRFLVWAMSRHSDILKLNTFAENQALAYRSWKTNGDVFTLIKQKDRTKYMPYGLRLHLIEADRVCTPNGTSYTTSFWTGGARNTVGKNPDNGNYIYNGVEIDSDGAIVAYHICNTYPNSDLKGYNREWKRVEAFGKQTGNQNVIHLMKSNRPEQYRGIPDLAPVIETLKQISRYTDAELMAAVIQAFYTVFIQVEGDKTENPLSDVIGQEEKVTENDTAPSYELGAGAVNVLGKGEKVTLADPKRPNSGFDTFMASMAKVLGAALDVPYEILMKSFTSSYSASRAALLEAWKTFKIDRAEFAGDFCQPIYEMWLAEDIALGFTSAPGFFTSPFIRAAWCRAYWVGPTQGQIDPVKEVTAAILRVRHAFSTHEREATELNGSNFDDNIQQVTLENALLREANPVDYPLPGDQPTNSNSAVQNAVESILRDVLAKCISEEG